MIEKTNGLILTAGPTISYKEVEYVTDAVLHGWNFHHSDYIKRFETEFAEYIGVKYALATSSCTGALHLALMAMGIGPGDEVILPDITWIATASAVCYVGATPVFADIDPKTWVMDPASVKKLISKQTKVIIPVHLYGNPVEMGPVMQMASEYGIDVLEDAAPAIGAEYDGRKTGSFGRAAAVSFQGAKALVTGEGGMLVSNDEELIERARLIGDHGRDPHRAFYNIQIGYKYKMSNLQAALGLGQIERAEEIVAQKRTIYHWYYERLNDIDDIQLNFEKPNTRNIFWMTSMVLGKSHTIGRDDFIKKLKENNIDSRPFFYPISSFPMFKGVKVNNSVSYDIPYRSINLPSGHERTEEEIDYICAHIKKILGRNITKVSPVQPTGWLAYRDNVDNIFAKYKKENDQHNIPIQSDIKQIGWLRPVGIAGLENSQEIRLLAKWREQAQIWFPSQFAVTEAGTKTWLDKQVLQKNDRILFMIETPEKVSIGHAGLFRFDYQKRCCELDNIIRGEKDILPGIMTQACNSLLDWTFNTLDISNVYLRVVSDNIQALKLYNRLEFKEIQRIPLMKVEEANCIRWIEVIGKPYEEIERYFVTMKLTKDEWLEMNGR
jgi:dTDP-4-amino-4,6-dideoxygalactose transaminase/RimJ/RimL family protein N-acetyltransferase